MKQNSHTQQVNDKLKPTQGEGGSLGGGNTCVGCWLLYKVKIFSGLNVHVRSYNTGNSREGRQN